MSELVRFYVVTSGRCSGIFTSRSRVSDATIGFPGAKVKKFLTFAEAEQFLKNSASTTQDNQVADDWDGPAYAVAVGRRMGIFRDHHAALRQTLFYSGNRLKKFPSYTEAVNFLDHHNWRAMPESCDNSGIAVSTDGVDTNNCSEGETSVASSEEPNPQDATHSERKRESDDDNDANELRPVQRRRVTSESISTKDSIYALCLGRLRVDDQGNEIVEMVCEFPLFPEWNVLQRLHGPTVSTTRAGLLAVLETLRRASREDPNGDIEATIFTIHQPLFDVLCKCAEEGWQSVNENQDLLKRIAQEKNGRCVKFLQVGGACKWGIDPNDRNTQPG